MIEAKKNLNEIFLLKQKQTIAGLSTLCITELGKFLWFLNIMENSKYIALLSKTKENEKELIGSFKSMK